MRFLIVYGISLLGLLSGFAAAYLIVSLVVSLVAWKNRK